MSKFLFLILSLTYNASAFYLTPSAHCSQRFVQVGFANGMNNSLDNAYDSLFLIIDSNSDLRTLFFLSYNVNEKGLSQVREVLLQKLYSFKNEKYYIAPDWMRHLGRYLFTQKAIDEIILTDDDLNRHMARYEKILNSGGSIAMISHSQGNFYTNFAYQKLSKKYSDIDNRFRAVAVGSPDDYTPRDDNYFNFSNDFVLMLAPGSMQGLYKRHPSSPGTFNHSFNFDYYSPSQLRVGIDTELRRHVEDLRKDYVILNKTVYSTPIYLRDYLCVDWMKGFKKPKNVEACIDKCSLYRVADMSDFSCPDLCEDYCCSSLDYNKDGEELALKKAKAEGYKVP